MKEKMSKWRRIAGISCIVLGVLALLTPFTPGAWLIIVGLGVLGIELTIHENHWISAFAKRFGFKLRHKKVDEPLSTDESSKP